MLGFNQISENRVVLTDINAFPVKAGFIVCFTPLQEIVERIKFQSCLEERNVESSHGT